MAKVKLDWFKLECQNDDKLDLIEAEFGLTGFAVVVKLWQKIYGSDGYYCEWNDDVALVFAKKNGVGANAVSEIIQAAIRRGIFDEKMFTEFGILTSRGIQNRYFDIISRRKSEISNPEYLLACHTQNSENVGISSKNVDISSKNVDISSQIREDKKREDKNRIDKNREDKNSSDKPKRTRFIPPTLDEVKAYCVERKNNVDPQHFIDYYESNGWKVGKNPMKDWKAAVRTWEKNGYGNGGTNGRTDSNITDDFLASWGITKV